MFSALLPMFLFAVVSAREAKEGEVPYQASIRTENGHICSGAILDKKWILTSARCLMRIRRREVPYVVVGTNDVTAPGTSFPVETIHKHPNYISYKHDIALVKVNGTIKFNDKIQPVQLPERNTKPEVTMLYSGWKGPSDSYRTNKLLMRNVTSIPSAECQKQLGPHLERDQICTLDNDAYRKGQDFFDDKGGPIVEGSKLAAIASVPRRKNVASVHIRVYEVLPWITVTRDPDTIVH
ncbi:chymotrypsin-2-like [Pieris rapae]|uniref:chymotrypsin-2-like n=1 Tax=Pieris rapae TaxID=64459 RepID=UPI001E27C2C9|nr:chymotrypsin-2-like [Pieris rapae]